MGGNYSIRIKGPKGILLVIVVIPTRCTCHARVLLDASPFRLGVDAIEGALHEPFISS